MASSLDCEVLGLLTRTALTRPPSLLQHSGEGREGPAPQLLPLLRAKFYRAGDCVSRVPEGEQRGVEVIAEGTHRTESR